jgi:hypothetical protein
MSSIKNAVGLFALTFLSTAGLRETRKNEQQGQGGNYRNIVIFTKKNGKITRKFGKSHTKMNSDLSVV